MKTAFGPCRVALGVVYAFVVGNAYGATLAPPNGAEQVCVDTHLAVTFDQAPQVGSAGTIRVLGADGTEVDRIDLADPASGRKAIGGAVSDNGTLHLFNYHPVIVTGTTAAIYLHRQLAYGQTYSVNIGLR